MSLGAITIAKGELGFKYFEVNHKFNIVDAEMDVYTQREDRMWGFTKWLNQKVSLYCWTSFGIVFLRIYMVMLCKG